MKAVKLVATGLATGGPRASALGWDLCLLTASGRSGRSGGVPMLAWASRAKTVSSWAPLGPPKIHTRGSQISGLGEWEQKARKLEFLLLMGVPSGPLGSRGFENSHSLGCSTNCNQQIVRLILREVVSNLLIFPEL